MKKTIVIFLSVLLILLSLFSLVSCASVEDMKGRKVTSVNLEFNFFETGLFEKTGFADLAVTDQIALFSKSETIEVKTDDKTEKKTVTCYICYCETAEAAAQVSAYLEGKLPEYDTGYSVKTVGTTVYLGREDSFDKETLELWSPELANDLVAFIKAEKKGDKILIGYCKTTSATEDVFAHFEGKLSEYGSKYRLEKADKTVCLGTSQTINQANKKLWTSQLYHTFIEDNNYMFVVEGIINTLIITFGALIIGVFFGLLFAILKYYAEGNPKLWIINFLYDLYTTVIRGIPITVLLLIFFFIILVSANGVVVAIIAFGINSSAYMAELVRGGINAVDKGQMEAARSLGMSKWQAMWTIIFPQAIKNILPAIGNECIALLKETSVAGYVAVVDLTRGVNLIRNNTYDAFNPLILSAIIYLGLVILMTKLLSILEGRLRRSDR